jgi:hypothetical protein
MATFTAGNPIALIIGTPLSGLLLNLDGFFGLQGWQWVYLFEWVPPLLLGVLIPFLLPASPEKATFLTAEERTWLIDTLARERRERELAAGGDTGHASKLLKALLSPKVITLAVAYYGLTNLNGAISTFLPQTLKPFGLSNTTTTFVAAIPYVFGLAEMLVLGRIADRPGRRAFAIYLGLGIAFVGLVASAELGVPSLKLIALCVTSLGVFGVIPTFWGLPTAILTGTAGRRRVPPGPLGPDRTAAVSAHCDPGHHGDARRGDDRLAHSRLRCPRRRTRTACLPGDGGHLVVRAIRPPRHLPRGRRTGLDGLTANNLLVSTAAVGAAFGALPGIGDKAAEDPRAILGKLRVPRTSS